MNIKTKILILSAIVIFSLTNCTVHKGLTNNFRNNNTQVVLAKDNFKVINTVKGEAEIVYIFGFGGMKQDALVAEARAEMVSRAKMKDTSRAIINETVEIKYSYFPIVRKYKVVVSGQVIEFIGD